MTYDIRFTTPSRPLSMVLEDINEAGERIVSIQDNHSPIRPPGAHGHNDFLVVVEKPSPEAI